MKNLRIILIGQGLSGSLEHLPVVLIKKSVIDGDLRRCKGGRGNKVEVRVTGKLASEPEERLLEVVVGLG